MIVPEYWAEATRKAVIGKRQVTIKRFGWSDVSEAEAQENADARADEAIAMATAGKLVRKVDHKVPYNGAEGLPIREEVISRDGDVVITRNSYGALCLNTPDVLFADIDFMFEPTARLMWISFLLLAVVAVIGGFYISSWKIALLFLGGAALGTQGLAGVLLKGVISSQGGREKMALSPIQAFSSNHPDWNIRVYKTPMGYRLLVMNRTFDPRGEEALGFFNEIKADPQYVRMCKNQNCFRARISPKPWRIGMTRLGPRPGIWPIKPERMAARREWVNKYERAARNYASCKFIVHLGSQITDQKAESVRLLHDSYCQAEQQLELA